MAGDTEGRIYAYKIYTYACRKVYAVWSYMHQLGQFTQELNAAKDPLLDRLFARKSSCNFLCFFIAFAFLLKEWTIKPGTTGYFLSRLAQSGNTEM